MYRQFDIKYSPNKSINTVDDMEHRLNAVINANEKLVNYELYMNFRIYC